MNIIVRPTGILIEGDRMLLVKQYVTEKRGWSMPGGKLEAGETIERCLIREWKEETGLDVAIKELLYVTDRFSRSNTHTVHMTFLLERTGEKPGSEFEWTHWDQHASKSSKMLREIKMVPINELLSCGFSSTFYQLIKNNFPGRGSYQGNFDKFYGEESSHGR
jgi:ADP-ribose pyrophosphatase YjhB (NUDIX family)